MSTERATTETQWDQIRTTMETGGPNAVIALIENLPEAEQMKVYDFAQRSLGAQSWEGKNFDDYIALATWGIGEALRRSESATDAEQVRRWKDTANMFSYNMAADLAECWPGDEVPRERRHFEAGLRAADDCVRWREELGKPASKRAMAEWAQGIHRMSLGDADGAITSFRAAFDRVAEQAAADGTPSTPGPDASFDVNLYAANLGLAELAAGNPAGRERYTTARDGFRAQLASDDKEKREDAEIGLGQVEVMEGKVILGDRE